MSPAPTTKKELFEKLNEIIQHGPYTMQGSKYDGTGGPGLYLRGEKDFLKWLMFKLYPNSQGKEIK